MAAAGFQASLFDVDCPAQVEPLGPHVARTQLGRGAWVDVRRGFITGADALFHRLHSAVRWRAERRPMYDRVVDVPRLLSFFDVGDPLPDAVLDDARRRLSDHYAAELGEPFTTAGLCLYRDGHDSVAWHGDRIGRGNTHDTMVAIIVLGAPRALLLRPRPSWLEPAAGASDVAVSPGTGATPAPTATIRHDLGHGDLLVMGGSCQRTWEHAVPKTARPVGPRISVQFRPHGVR